MNEDQVNEVEAVKSFAHGTDRRPGDRFAASKSHAEALVKAGLVRVVSDDAPMPAPTPAAKRSRKAK